MTTDSDRPADLLDRFRVWADAAAPQPGAGPVDPDRADVAMRAVIASDAIEADAEALARHRFSEIGNQVMRDLEALERDRTHPPDGDALTDEAIAEREAAIRERASEALAKLSSADRSRLAKRRRARPRPMLMKEAKQKPRPLPILSTPHGDGTGQVLSVGEVMMLSGEGGIGKSALVTEIALALAVDRPEGTGAAGLPSDMLPHRTVGDLFRVHGPGPGGVLWMAYEEQAGEIGARMEALQRVVLGDDDAAIQAADGHLQVMPMEGAPLFGPGERSGGAGLYTARPEPLAGWRDMYEAAEAMRPRLVIIDPALAAYVAEANNPTAVREFLISLAIGFARPLGLGVIVVGHSNKESRGGGNSDPFAPGKIGGTAAWTDAARGSVIFDFPGEADRDLKTDPEGTTRQLAVHKANMGPRYLLCPALPRRAKGSQWIVGFHRDPHARGWQTLAERHRDREAGEAAAGPVGATDGSGLPPRR